MPTAVYYQCPECGLRCSDQPTVRQCKKRCSEYRSCSLEIYKLSLEYLYLNRKRGQGDGK